MKRILGILAFLLLAVSAQAQSFSNMMNCSGGWCPPFTVTGNNAVLAGTFQTTAVGVNTTPGAAGTVTVGQGTITTDLQGYAGTATWNSSGVTFTGFKQTITDTASTAGSKHIEFFTGATSEFKIDKAGNVVANGYFQSGGPLYINGGNKGGITAGADGVFEVFNNAGTDFARLQFGGTTSSFPAIARSGTTAIFELADASLNTSVAAESIRLGQTTGVGVLSISSQAPTVSSGFGSGASFGTGSTSFAFDLNVGTTPGTTGVLALPTASHGWVCTLRDMTTVADLTNQTAYTTTTASFAATIGWSNNDHLVGSCKAF